MNRNSDRKASASEADKPEYRLLDIEKKQQEQEDKRIGEAALRIFRKHRKAFEELAK